jgi:hypothetical protein
MPARRGDRGMGACRRVAARALEGWSRKTRRDVRSTRDLPRWARRGRSRRRTQLPAGGPRDSRHDGPPRSRCGLERDARMDASNAPSSSRPDDGWIAAAKRSAFPRDPLNALAARLAPGDDGEL